MGHPGRGVQVSHVPGYPNAVAPRLEHGSRTGWLRRGSPQDQRTRSSTRRPGLAIADLQPVALQVEGTRLVRIGVLRRKASLDMMSHYLLVCVHGVGAEVCDIGGVSGESVLG
jgi:hypothetical protein